jgi:hypothetical protein
MQHTVVAFFDTYPQAEAAREALFAAGIAPDSVALKAKCEPTYASDATSAYESAPVPSEGLLASIERFFESLFQSAPPEQERAHYAEAVRRGAVMICVEAPTDALAQLTRTTLEAMGPLDIEERAATWTPPIDEASRSHSPLEELGLRPSVPVATTPPRSAVYSYPRAHPGATEPLDTTTAAESPLETAPGTAATEAAAIAVAAGSAPGMGAVFTSGRPPAATAPAPAPASEPPRTPAVPDEYLQNEETYRGDEPGPGTR